METDVRADNKQAIPNEQDRTAACSHGADAQHGSADSSAGNLRVTDVIKFAVITTHVCTGTTLEDNVNCLSHSYSQTGSLAISNPISALGSLESKHDRATPTTPPAGPLISAALPEYFCALRSPPSEDMNSTRCGGTAKPSRNAFTYSRTIGDRYASVQTAVARCRILMRGLISEDREMQSNPSSFASLPMICSWSGKMCECMQQTATDVKPSFRRRCSDARVASTSSGFRIRMTSPLFVLTSAGSFTSNSGCGCGSNS